jgi:hypothetical protein
MSLVLEFVEQEAPRSVGDFLDCILLKFRETSGSEAGTIYMVRRKDRQPVLDPVHRHNDAVALRGGATPIPLNASTIAGYVAMSGETAIVRDAQKISEDRPYGFDVDQETPDNTTRSVCACRSKTFRTASSPLSSCSTGASQKRRVPPPRSPGGALKAKFLTVI